MTTQDGIRSTPVGHLLTNAHSLAEAGDFTAALAAARQAKTLEPKNVYVLAFEKQTEQLMEFSAAGTLTEEQRGDVLESMPGIIEKAVELSRTSSGVTIISGLGSSKSMMDIERERKEKGAALEWLKNQYFQHAHEYVRKGEYQHALAEIRRVYIIDSTNKVAKDFEKQIEQLAHLKTPPATRVHPAIIPPEPEIPRVTIAPHVPDPAGQEQESLPMMTEEWSSPRELTRQRPVKRKTPVAAPKEQESKGTTLLMVLIFLALIVLGATILWYYQRNVLSKRSPTDKRALPPAASEQFLGAPGEAEEQKFVVTSIATDSGEGDPQVTQVPSEEKPRPEKLAADRPALTQGKTVNRPSTTESPPEKETPAQAGSDTRNPAAGSVVPLQAVTSAPAENRPATEENTDSSASLVPFIAVENEAKILKLQQPRFSAEAFQRGVIGQVVISVHIDATGKPLETVTLKSTNDALIQPSIDAIMASQFTPAEGASGPVMSWLTIPFKFTTK
jgi:TonB family protein